MDCAARRRLARAALVALAAIIATGCIGARLPGPLGDRLGPQWKYLPSEPWKTGAAKGRYERAYEEFFAAGEYLEAAPYADRLMQYGDWTMRESPGIGGGYISVLNRVRLANCYFALDFRYLGNKRMAEAEQLLAAGKKSQDSRYYYYGEMHVDGPLRIAIQWQREHYPERAARLDQLAGDLQVAVVHGPKRQDASSRETPGEFTERIGGDLGAKAAPGSVVILPTAD